ncbi:MAG: dUTP diphosphatase [Candidatus Moranbacteria bacterium]|nr:dUTP diphosphatase [Candidatus Moranbacteria bacterium]
MKIFVKKLEPEAKIPSYAHPGDAGMDLYSLENVNIKPGERVSCRTGIAIQIPGGYAGLIWDKSGIAWNGGIKTVAGVIDSGYRGEVGIVLVNLGHKDYKINKGDKIAQMLIQKVEDPEIIEAENLEESARGNGRFGSTGVS